jgi:protein TonB
MAEMLSLYRCATLGVSCLIHVAVVGGAIALGRDFVTPRPPAILVADLTPIESARPVESPKPAAVAPARAKPEKLTRPKPIATPTPSTTPEPRIAEAPMPPLPVVPGAPPAGGPAVASAPSASFDAAASVPFTAAPTDEGRNGSGSGAVPLSQSAAAVPSEGVTRTAIPRGGYQVRPSYPSSARRLGIQGMTTLRVFVASDGRVGEVVIHESAGHPDLDHAAAEAVKRWRFEPARRGAEAVGVWVLLPVEFRLR